LHDFVEKFKAILNEKFILNETENIIVFTIGEEDTQKLEYALFNAKTNTFVENGSIDRSILDG